MHPKVIVEYQDGTIALRNLRHEMGDPPAGGRHDPRDDSLRFEGCAYASVITWLVRAKIDHEDRARAYDTLTLRSRILQTPFPYQTEALEAWLRVRRRGVVVLPTGAGKSYLATMAIHRTQRSTLVVVPTLDLVSQWFEVLKTAFGVEVGIVGGGYHEVCALTVTTYDSAHLHAERLGNRFGLVIYDECHHLPGESFAFAARSSIAPFRLGLTATPERADGRHELLYVLVGPGAYRREITELTGEYLAEYETVTLHVELDPEEREAYDQARAVYTSFLRSRRIDMRASDGWRRFVIESSRSPEGRQAFTAYRRQKELAMAAGAKMRLLEQLLHQHRGERALVFTQDNATAYAIARQFLVPIITHQTKTKERANILAGLRSGTYGAVVTSKVLNEGVDVPEANVAIILSGSGSVREHVQRLGRILRRGEGKLATLYEIVTASTGEEWVSQRRRDHGAYR